MRFTRRLFQISLPFICVMALSRLVSGEIAFGPPIKIKGELSNTDRIRLADFNGDGRQDIIVADGLNFHLFERKPRLNPHYFYQKIKSPYYSINMFEVGDTNADGLEDIVTSGLPAYRYNYDFSVIAFIMQPGSAPRFSVSTIASGLDFGGTRLVTDLDRDGDPDVLTSTPHKIYFHENQGRQSPVFQTRILAEAPQNKTFEYPNKMIATDIDLDGDQDFFAGVPNQSGLGWFENSGGRSPSFTSHDINSNFQENYIEAAADIDGDGDQDLIVLGSHFRTFLVWHENGGGSPPVFTPHIIDESSGFGTSIVADIDADNDFDMLMNVPKTNNSHDGFLITMKSQQVLVPIAIKIRSGIRVTALKTDIVIFGRPT